ncbi:MAG: phosphate transport system substrate-binding protein [Solirubrobacteraceae bacterium]|nr:phosphate transport system substrate-binding protein [Solirubrobacteraceae bacterium]
MISRRRARHAAVPLAACLGASVLGSCGVDTAKVGAPDAGGSLTPAASRPALPDRPPAEVDIDGGREALLTQAIVKQFSSHYATRVQLSLSGAEEQGFKDLCAGRIDIADATRAISAAETAACKANGLSVSAPITIGSDALVIATKNESDVGGDCISVGQVRDIFRSGSPVINWDQLSFDNLAIRATGRSPRTDIFDFFAYQVLGITSGATRAEIRNDYLAQSSDDRVRAAVTQNAALASALDHQRVAAALRTRQIAAEKRAFVSRAAIAADKRVLAQIAAVNRENARRRVHVDAAKLIAANRRKDEQAKSAATASASRQFDLLLASGTPIGTDPALTRTERPGVVGFFRFTYYEQFEDQLRPLEIDPTGTPKTSTNGAAVASTGASSKQQPDCVFPSRTTITNASYPLTRRIVLYTTTASIKRPEVETFLQYYLRNTQTAARDHALVPITDQQRDAAITAVTGRQPTRPARTTPSTGATGVSTGPAGQAGSGGSTGQSAVSPGVVPGVAPQGAG